MLTVSPEVMQKELKAAIEILTKWDEQLGQVPGLHLPATNPEAFTRFVMELMGELRIVSAKCDALSDTLSTGLP